LQCGKARLTKVLRDTRIGWGAAKARGYWRGQMG
jgi:hypothetical protein